MAASGHLSSKPTTPANNGDYEAVVFLLNDIFAEVTKNEVAETSNGSIIYVNGVLTVVEKVSLTSSTQTLITIFVGSWRVY